MAASSPPIAASSRFGRVIVVFARKSKKNRSLARHKAMIIVPYPAHGEATKDKKAEVMTMLRCKNRFKIL